MELTFTLFIKFALSILIILALFLINWNIIKFISKVNFNSAANLFYNFKYNGRFLFPNPSRGFVNEKHCCV
jgi:hypothetical protein